jgi:hypothetical protein
VRAYVYEANAVFIWHEPKHYAVLPDNRKSPKIFVFAVKLMGVKEWVKRIL